MPIRLNEGEYVGGYEITELSAYEAFITQYFAKNADGSNQECEVRQFKSPVPSVGWFQDYVTHLNRIKEKISNNPTLESVCEDTLAIIVAPSDKHTGLFRVTSRAPTTLGELLDANELSGSERFLLAQSIAEALAAMHKGGLVHINLFPYSIGVRSDGSIVFLGMDWVRFLDEAAPWDGHMGEVGFPGYLAPELNNNKPTTASDVYSLGCLLIELLTGAPVDVKHGSNSSFSITYVDGLPNFDRSAVASILKQCLDDVPAVRPTIDALIAGIGFVSSSVSERHTLIDCPRWIKQSLQTLAYWVAYQNEVYRHHLLPEGAIVAELTRLVDSTIDSDLIVVREPLYRSLVSGTVKEWKGAERADLAVKRRSRSSSSICDAVIEVKRANTQDDKIDEDLVALALFKSTSPHVRVFLIVVSQAHLPQRWVTGEGTALRDTETLRVELEDRSTMEVHYRVRSVYKAAGSFKSPYKASFCCLVEVL